LSLSLSGIFFAGVLAGGFLLLGIFSMLAMARKQDDDQDRLEIELCRKYHPAPHGNHAGSPNHSDSVSINPDL
jgi:hypothetical protein